jgi:hypothetical protein
MSGQTAPRGIVSFHCILRTLQLRDECRVEAYGELFAGTPMVGFSTYGESSIGHINQTSTMPGLPLMPPSSRGPAQSTTGAGRIERNADNTRIRPEGGRRRAPGREVATIA